MVIYSVIYFQSIVNTLKAARRLTGLPAEVNLFKNYFLKTYSFPLFIKVFSRHCFKNTLQLITVRLLLWWPVF